MAKFLDCLEALYGTRNLYEVLEVSKDATATDIKRAYYSVSLKVHPDRATEEERESATKKFQALSQTYCILSDSDKRSIYDASGDVDDETDALQQERNWESYWRLLFKEVTLKDIKEYEFNYRNSEAEKTDVLAAYVMCEGDIDMILETVPCCTVEDDERFKEIIDAAITDNKVEPFQKYGKDTRNKKQGRRKRAAAEAREATAAAKELGMTDGGDQLKSIIMERNQNRAKECDSFFDQLEAKYAKPKKINSAVKKQKR